jgi:hypothetical protein
MACLPCIFVINDIKVMRLNPPTFVVTALLALGVVFSTGVQAQLPLFKDADLQLGQELITTHKCEACHARRVGGDGSDIYNPDGRINSAALLRGMVEYCNTELNLGMFPEEVTAVAAVINRRHYKFK